ncbi:MAG: nitroreductase family protein [Deltaproteobacteria bacterium]|nr:nitroreductase family protein [Deltaproteobacteria bacterium]MBW2391083.1 nitroreductase family protein [Deltaproteobacteria bacterium]
MTAPFDLNETDRLLSTTRAVRRRLDLERPVGRDVILDCVRLSQQAPTASNTQQWRWMVVMDPAKREALGEIYARGKRFIDRAKSQIPDEDAQTHRVYDSAGWLLDNMGKAPALVIPCLQGRLPDGAPHGTVAATYGSIFPAIWNFQLALRSRGLGSTLTTISLFFEADVAKLLSIPDDVMQVALLPVACTKGTDFKLADRPPPEEITSFDEWSF